MLAAFIMRKILKLFIIPFILIFASCSTNELKVRVSMISVKNVTLANKIFSELENGKNFEDMAIDYSIGPKKDFGGDLGYIYIDELDKIFRLALDTIEIGEYTNVIKKDSEYIILKKNDIKHESDIKIDYNQKPKKLFLEIPTIKGWNETIFHVNIKKFGYTYHFESLEQTVLMVAVYNLGLDSIPNNLDSEILTKRFKECKNEAKRNIEVVYEEAEIIELESTKKYLDDSNNHSNVHCLYFSYSIRNNKYNKLNELYLTTYKNHIIQIRIIIDQNKQNIDKNIEIFLSHLNSLIVNV
jgi:hypothetical protein